MSKILEDLGGHIESSFPDEVDVSFAFGEISVEVPSSRYLEVARFLRDDSQCAFDQLSDLCGIDYLTYGLDEWDTDGSSFTRGVKRTFSFEVDEEGLGSNVDFDGKRFAVVSHLLSVKKNQRIRLKVFCEDNEFPVLDSLTDIWNSANWYEREAFDLYGVMFNGHPDLRRILTDYGFIGHPFRKDFPLIGQLEMRYDDEQKRVVYEPVSIEPRVLVPRIIRESKHAPVSSGED